MKKIWFITLILSLVALSPSSSYSENIRYEGIRVLGMGNANLTFLSDYNAMYYNPALMDNLEKRFYLSFAQSGLSFDNSFLGFTTFLMTNILNFRKFQNDIESINRGFANSVGEYDLRRMNMGANTDFNLIVYNYGIGAWSSFLAGVYYDDGVYIPQPSIVASHQSSASFSAGFRVLKDLSIGFSPKYWIRIDDEIKIVASEYVEGAMNLNDDHSVGFVDTTSKIYRIANKDKSITDFGNLSFDIGAIYHMRHMRYALVLRDMFHTGNADASVMVDLGFGIRAVAVEEMLDIKQVLYTVELHDTFGDDYLFKKINTGVEIDHHPFAIRGGISQGYFTWGASMSFIGVRVDFASFAKEEGRYPGMSENRTYRLGFRLGI